EYTLIGMLEPIKDGGYVSVGTDITQLKRHEGKLIDGERRLMATIAESWHQDGRLSKPGIVATIMSNLGLERHLNNLGLSMARTAVGDRYVLEHMREHGFNVGGEQSGHIILSDYSTTGDGLIAALQVLAVQRRENRPVSEICHRFEPLPQILKNVQTRGGQPLKDAKVSSAIEKLRADLGESGRLVIRPSGTEPVIRVMAEGDDRDLVERIVDDVIDVISKAA
ncbi:MAG TPA: hypothetical protein PKW21_15705, partial [Rhabdaerophilum sp.]|nr:hypothetical protein [Rhabdaerophilum sp.]